MSSEAEEHLRRYLAGSDDRLRWLREWSAATGGPPPATYDFSRDSLVPIWAWAISRFRLRPEGEPVDATRQPVWYGRRQIQAPHFWSDETIALADGLMYYLAGCLLRVVPSARWVVGHSPLANWIHENQPVLTGFTAPVDLVMPMMNLVGRVFQDPSSPYFRGPAGPHDLQRQFDILVGQAVADQG